MLNFDSFLLTSGIILTLLISATVISYTSKFIFTSEKLRKSTNQIYDPDQGLNISTVCIFSKNPYATRFERSPCFNKTLMQWYNPWVQHELWTGFWNEIKARNRLKQIKLQQAKVDITTESPFVKETVPPTDLPPVKEKAEQQKAKESPVEFVYSVLVGLLIISGIVAFWEVCKDRFKKNEANAAKAQERQCTLADFTINRHLRKESQQQAASHLPRQGSLELTTKVTQNLIHQSSLDRAFPETISEVISSLETRRNSMPLFNSDFPGTLFSPTLNPAKRSSLDIAIEEMNFYFRKKPRHFIRRH